MESSSEESFAWTNASSDSSDDNMAPSMMNGNQSGEESENGTKYKKKLHKEIFSSSQDGITSQKTSSKRKITYEQSDSDSNGATSKKKIKVEPESDHESQKKKKKARSAGLNRDTSEEEGYLNIKVKEEHMFQTPKDKHNQKHKRLDSEKELEARLKSEREFNQSAQMHNNLHKSNSNGVDEEAEFKVNKKKKKKSKKRRNSSETSMSIDEKNHNEETIEKEPIQNNITLNTFLEHSKDEISIIEKVIPSQDHNVLTPTSIKKKRNNASHSLEMNSDNNSSQIRAEKSINHTGRLSDGLVEEDVSESNPYNGEDHNVMSSKLKKFVKRNSHLKAIVDQLQNEAAITKDDEIWLVKCPTEVEASSFETKKLTLDGKFKVKMDGYTYEGHTLAVNDRVALMSVKHNHFIVSSVPVAGIIHLQRKVPKPHLQDNNIIENNVTSFIPLPVIKCRHPLFGADYKAAIKIPVEINEKLNVTQYQMSDTNSKKKNKRNKKERRLTEQKDVDVTIEPKEEPFNAQGHSVRKKKKRKTTQDDEITPHKKIKHKKLDFTSPGAWDSEKAIEQNLFSF